jgi:hypothetical protein
LCAHWQTRVRGSQATGPTSGAHSAGSTRSTVFAACNHWGGGDKQKYVWPYIEHKGGETFQVREKIRFLEALSGSPMPDRDQSSAERPSVGDHPTCHIDGLTGHVRGLA